MKYIKARQNEFTIHFATINTNTGENGNELEKNLQYTLLLLIPTKGAMASPSPINLQYTLLLLIQYKCQSNISV